MYLSHLFICVCVCLYISVIVLVLVLDTINKNLFMNLAEVSWQSERERDRENPFVSLFVYKTDRQDDREADTERNKEKMGECNIDR